LKIAAIFSLLIDLGGGSGISAMGASRLDPQRRV
jgi:hypothetical protein